MASEWTELAYMQRQAGNTAICVFALAVVFVFLVLAAQYESWKLPLAVILVVPMCLLCSIVGVELAGMDVNIFTQIGFVVLVGLASKNAILIVEFAKQRQEAGVPAARRPRSVPAAAAADPDDLVRLHLRRRAAGARRGGRRRDAPVAGHGGLQRHVNGYELGLEDSLARRALSPWLPAPRSPPQLPGGLLRRLFAGLLSGLFRSRLDGLRGRSALEAAAPALPPDRPPLL